MGKALSFACQHFGIDCEVFMVKLSYEHKPYRKVMMNTWGLKFTHLLLMQQK